MATDTENTTENTVKTVDQVKELLAEGKTAKEIAEKLGKTPATIYVHIRKLGGGNKGKRGRPPKAKTEGEQPAEKAKATRSRPPVGNASSNGHDKSVGERFPLVKQAIEAELSEARSQVAVLEGMLSSVS